MRAIGVVLLLGCFYFLFAGEVSETEMFAAIPALVIGGGFALLERSAGDRRQEFSRTPWGRTLLHPLISLATDSVRVGGVLLRVIRRRPNLPVGAMSDQSFRFGGANAADAGRRALVTLGASLAPNGYVVRLDDQEQVLRLHRLVQVPPQADTEWPI